MQVTHQTKVHIHLTDAERQNGQSRNKIRDMLQGQVSAMKEPMAMQADQDARSNNLKLSRNARPRLRRMVLRPCRTTLRRAMRVMKIILRPTMVTKIILRPTTVTKKILRLTIVTKITLRPMTVRRTMLRPTLLRLTRTALNNNNSHRVFHLTAMLPSQRSRLVQR
jgi:hypothetical protein